MTDYIDNFKSFLINDKKASSNTLESYLRDIIQFSSYCTSVKISDLKDVTSDLVNGYFEYLSGVGKSVSTQNRILASIRCFYRCLSSKGIVSVNPVECIKIKKFDRKLPDVLDTTEIMQLLEQPNTNEYKGIRDKAMLELLYATGIKVSELVELKIFDINLQIGILRIKTDEKERIIPIYPGAVKSISDYLVNVRSAIVLDESQDRLFTNMNGQHLSRQGFWKIIKYYANAAGIKKDITPHTLRHCFATHLLENGAELKDIKEMLGHSDISSTQIYAQLIKSKYTSNYAKFHPLAR